MDPSSGADFPPTAATEGPVREGELSDDGLRPINSRDAHQTLPLSGSRVRSESSFTPYHRPIRSETPRSSQSTLAPSLRDLTPSPASMAQQDDLPETGVIAIGMALGSPTQPPPSSMAVWPYQSCVPSVTTTVEAQSPNRSDSTRSKPRKWGIFRSRSKKGKVQDDHGANQSASAPSSTGHHVRVTSTTERAARLSSDSPRRKPKTLVKSRTEPTAVERSKSPLSFLTRAISKDGQEVDHLKRETIEFFRSPSPPSPLSDNLLDVDIPDVTMERYSVMFSHLLENRSTTSLLARRQATRDRIKAVREGEGQPPANQAQVPSSFPTIMISGSAIPSLRLARPEGSPDLKPLSRQRSHTFPVMLSSPTQTDFEAREPSQEQIETPRHVAASVRRGSSKYEAPAAANSSSSNPRPMLISKYHQRSLSDQSLRSSPTPASTLSPGGGATRVGSGPPSGQTWKSAHPPLSGSTTQSIFSPLAAQSITSPSEASPAGKDASHDPVEISIARQISVSRQQRAMLGPLQRQMLDSKRLNATKSSMPRLVDPARDPDSPVFRQGERAVVEGV